MEEKITIIEGPPPVFEQINDGWAIGLNESPILYSISFTQVRTFNGPALVERCHKAWKMNVPIFLHYKNEIGVEEKAPIVAVSSLETGEGQVLLIWVRQLPEFEELEDFLGSFDEEDEEDLDDDNEDDDEDYDYDDDDYEDDEDIGYLN